MYILNYLILFYYIYIYSLYSILPIEFLFCYYYTLYIVKFIKIDSEDNT